MSVFSLKNKHIRSLVEISSELKDLGSTIALLSWDQETYLTAKGAIARAHQLETLSGIYHQKSTAKRLGKILEALNDEIHDASHHFTPHDLALIREMQRDYTLATKLPEKLVRELSKESSLGLESWKHARNQNDFSLYEGSLSRMITLKREVAYALGFSGSPYDALLNEFEEGLTKEKVLEVFTALKPKLEMLIPKLTKATAHFDHGLFSQTYNKEKLWELSMDVLTMIGFNLERGRQDESTHPFTMGISVDDVRLTTRVLATNPISTLMSSIHEGGHGMYEQGISPDITHTTLGYINSLVVHESQSRFWENMIGKSHAFWEYFFPKFQSAFPDQLLHTDAAKAWEEVNIIRPSLIRVDADEVTYHMHIIIRTEIESELIEGTLSAKDVPERWNTAYKHYLGVEVPNDTLGCLQDIHWSQGLIGYFPTYSLGSIFAAQLFETLEKENPDTTDDIRGGKFENILHWLNGHIHTYGRLFDAQLLAKRITGKEIGADSFLTYIENKFT